MDEQKKNYDLAVEYTKVKDAIDDDYLSAAELFTLAGDYLDAAERAEECKALAEKCRAKMQAEKKRRKRTGDLLAWLSVLVCIVAFVLVKVLPDVKSFQKAKADFEKGDYAAVHAALYKSEDRLTGILGGDKLHYAAAQGLFDEGKYALAAEAFGSLEDYSDSGEKYILALEKGADKCAVSGDEKGAALAVEKLGEIPSYTDRLNETVYNTAVKLTESFEYQTAYELLKTLPKQENSSALLEKIPALCYKHAGECLAGGDKDKAIHFFGSKCMKYYKDSMERAHSISYAYGNEMLEDGEYEKAEKYLLLAKNTGDTAATLNELYYRWGKELMKSGEYDAAIEKFDNIGWYKDTVKYKDECHYILACSLAESGDTQKALKKFTALSGYKDSDERAAALNNQ